MEKLKLADLKDVKIKDPFWGATRSVVKSYGIRTHMI